MNRPDGSKEARCLGEAATSDVGNVGRASGSGGGSSVLRAMSCHPEFKCNLEIARKGKRRGG